MKTMVLINPTMLIQLYVYNMYNFTHSSNPLSYKCAMTIMKIRSWTGELAFNTSKWGHQSWTSWHRYTHNAYTISNAV